MSAPGQPHTALSPLSLCPSVTESQNHRTVGAGRDLCGSSSPTLLLKQGHLQQAALSLCCALAPGHAAGLQPEAGSAGPAAVPRSVPRPWASPAQLHPTARACGSPGCPQRRTELSPEPLAASTEAAAPRFSLPRSVKLTGTRCWKRNFHFSTPFPVHATSQHRSIEFRQPRRFFSAVKAPDQEWEK